MFALGKGALEATLGVSLGILGGGLASLLYADIKRSVKRRLVEYVYISTVYSVMAYVESFNPFLAASTIGSYVATREIYNFIRESR